MEPQIIEVEFDTHRFLTEMENKMRDDVLEVIKRNFETIRSVTTIGPTMRIRLMQAVAVPAMQLLSMEYDTYEAAATIAVLALAIEHKNRKLPPPTGAQVGDVGVEIANAVEAILKKALPPCSLC